MEKPVNKTKSTPVIICGMKTHRLFTSINVFLLLTMLMKDQTNIVIADINTPMSEAELHAIASNIIINNLYNWLLPNRICSVSYLSIKKTNV